MHWPFWRFSTRSNRKTFFQRVLEKKNCLSNNRAEEVRFHRFIWNEKMNVNKMQEEIFLKKIQWLGLIR